MEREPMTLPRWARTFAIVVGVVSIIAGFLVLVYPGLGLLAVVRLLAFALILLGVERLAMGISGHSYAAKNKDKVST